MRYMHHGSPKKLRALNAVLVIAGIAASLGLALVLLVISLADMQFSIPQTLKIEGNRMADRLSKSLVTGLWDFNTEALSRVMESEIQNPHVQALVLRNDEGDVFLTLRRGSNGGYMIDKSQDSSPQDGEPGLMFFAKTLNFRDQEIGTIEVYLTDRVLLEQGRAQLLRTLLIQLLVTGAVMGVLMVVLRWRVLKPITGTTMVIESFAEQDFNARVPSYPIRELARMAEVLNGMAASLQMYRHDMENLVQTRTQQLLETTRVAQWSMLITGLAHELNTPLGNSVMALGYLKERIESFEIQLTNGTVRRKDMEDFLQSLHESASLASDGLTWTTRFMRVLKTIEGGGALQERSTFDLGMFMEETEAAFRNHPVAREIRIETDFAPLPALDSYRDLLSLVLQHLFLLALGYSMPGIIDPELRLSARLEGDFLVLSLCDNGRGFNPDQLELLFSPYGLTSPKLGRHEQAIAHLALGPYILRSLLESVRGELVLSSKPGEGSCFTVRCPKWRV